MLTVFPGLGPGAVEDFRQTSIRPTGAENIGTFTTVKHPETQYIKQRS